MKAVAAKAFLTTLWHARMLRTRAAVEAHRNAGLRRLIAQAARTTAFYRPFADARWEDLPIVDKALVLARFQTFNTQGIDAERAWRVIAGQDAMPGFEVGCSTGTSGTRGLYIVSAAERFRWLGTILAKTRPAPRDRVAIVLPGPSPLYQAANESRVLTLAHFDPRQGLDRLIPPLEAFAPNVLLGAPKTLRGLALAGARLRLRKIFAAAEVLDPADAAIAERAFGAPVGQIYMATEGLLGASCRLGHLHLAEDIAAFELEPVAGDPGLVTPLLTDFTRRTQIMARYRLGDLLRRIEGPCPCGSAMHRVQVIGRHADLITLPSPSGGTPITLAPDRLRDAVTARGIDEYRIGLSAAKTLRLLLPTHIGRDRGKAAADALGILAGGAQVEIAFTDLAAPFDRKLRRIAPVPPETL